MLRMHPLLYWQTHRNEEEQKNTHLHTEINLFEYGNICWIFLDTLETREGRKFSVSTKKKTN